MPPGDKEMPRKQKRKVEPIEGGYEDRSSSLAAPRDVFQINSATSPCHRIAIPPIATPHSATTRIQSLSASWARVSHAR